MNVPTDRGLSMLAVRGDRDAFGELVRRHQFKVFNVAYRMLGNIQDAEDATQETFIKAYSAFNTFDTGRPLLPWLRQIATNVCLNRLKQQHLSLSLDDGMQTPTDNRPSVESQTANHEQGAQIRAAILSLPPHYRAVIEFRHYQDLSYAEIAKALDRPLSSVKSDLFRARKLLADKLVGLKTTWYTSPQIRLTNTSIIPWMRLPSKG